MTTAEAIATIDRTLREEGLSQYTSFNGQLDWTLEAKLRRGLAETWGDERVTVKLGSELTFSRQLVTKALA